MEPISLIPTISTTIVNAISTLLPGPAFKKFVFDPALDIIPKKIIGEEILERRKLEETALQPVLKKAIEEVAETIEPIGPAEIDQICLFLTSPEAETIIRQIYAASIVESREENLGEIREGFLKAFSHYTSISEEKLKDSATAIFKMLLQGCEQALQMASDRGILSAHEAKSAFRHRILKDELAAMRKNLEFLTAQQKLDVPAILQFEKLYRQQVADRHKSITPPYIEASGKLPIDKLYVSPNFKPKSEHANHDIRVSLAGFYESIYRAVVLGDPGIGKSTLTEKICYDLANQYSERLLPGRLVTPILVVLRQYAAEKKERNCSILQFIEVTANSKYQVKPPPGSFEYLLLNGRAVVIFDGLDELTDTSDRQEIARDVESFCNLYPSVPVLVTSRVVGYKEAPLDEERFETFRLADFNSDQVKEYVQKWFGLVPDLSPEERQQNIEAFLDESETVEDLRSNALMLGLMCNLYRGEGYIPRNRPDVYEKCTEMLFDRWDKRKQIPLPKPIQNIESQIRKAMMYLAHWIYTNELQGGVTERKLKEKATKYLLQRRFEDPDDAEQAAGEFISFCRGRAWVFTDTGTTQDGTRLYQFVHRTFLEYFTAAHLVRTYESPEKLAEVLLPRIAKEEWDVVAQLAVQKQNKNIDEAADKLLTSVIEQAHQVGEDEGWNLLSFAARCLGFIVPSPKVTRQIATACLDRCLTEGSKMIAQEKSTKNDNIDRFNRRHQLGYMTEKLLDAVAHENRAIVAEAIENLIADTLKSNSEFKHVAALELLIYLGIEYKEWEKYARQFFDSDIVKAEYLCKSDLNFSLIAYHLGTVSLNNIIEWHGLISIFQDCNYSFVHRGYESIAYCSLILYFIRDSHEQEKSTKLQTQRLHELKQVSRAFLSYPPPFPASSLSSRSVYQPFYQLQIRIIDSEKIKIISSDSDAIFGLFCLFAVLLEDSSDTEEGEAVQLIEENKIALFDSIRWTSIARFDAAAMDKVQAELDRCGFSPEQQTFAWRWVRREMNLVELEAPEEI